MIPIDVIEIAVCYALAVLIRLEQIPGFKDVPQENVKLVWQAVFSWPALVIPAIYVIIFFFADMYAFLLKHATLGDTLKCALANVAAAALSFLYNAFLMSKMTSNSQIIPRGVVIIASILILLATVATRIIPRVADEMSHSFEKKNSAKTHRIIIYGAGFEGRTLAADFKNGKARKNNLVVGFIDNNNQKIQSKLLGIKVYSASQDLEKLVKDLGADTIIIAIPSLSPSDLSSIIDKCKHTGCILKILPSISDMVENANIEASKLRDVSIDDILHRKETHIDIDSICQYLEGETVLVTGAGGSIGSELCRRILHYKPAKLVLFDIYENNVYDLEFELRQMKTETELISYIGSVRDYERLDALFKKENPGVVFHAAAHKHVPLMENSPGEAVKNNVFGTYNLAKAADANHVKTFVFISTDKAVNPTNVMGATKRMCEMIITAMDKVSETRYVAVRFGNVLGSNGSVVPLFKKQIAAMGPVTVTHPDIIRYFMTIPEAARLVVQAGAMAKGGEIFILDMGDPVKIDDLARDMIRLSGYTPDVDIKIEYTGLRPGEKLYEELMQAEEGTTKSSHDGIFIAKPETYTMEQVEEKLSVLRDAVGKDDETVVKCLAEVVPTFHPEKAGAHGK